VHAEQVHSDRFLQLSSDLPIVVECVETEEHIKSMLSELDRMTGGGLITLERANVIIYGTSRPGEDRPQE
jgi:PII-like signaling protein